MQPVSMGCAERRQLLADRQASEQAGAAEVDRLAAQSVESALLEIARARDARRDTESVTRLSRHPSAEVRAASLRALALIGDPASVSVLLAGLEDGAAEVRAMAGFALSQHWAWSQPPLQARTTAATIEQSLCTAVEIELEDHGLESPALSAYVRALAEFGGADPAVNDLLWSLFDADAAGPALVEQVLFSLAVQGKYDRSPLLSTLRLQRLAARLAAGTTGPPWRVAYLLAHSKVEEQATEPAQQLLQALLVDDPDGQQNCWALRAMGRLRAPGAAEILASFVPGQDSRQRLCAVRGAALLGEPGLPVLESALEDPEPWLAAEAARALGGFAEAGWTLLRAWPESEHRGAGPRAVSRLAGMTALITAAGDELPAWLVAGQEALLEAADAGTASEDPELRSVAYGLLASHPSAVALSGLLARIPIEKDPRAAIALAAAVGSRSEQEVEGSLLSWLEGEDVVLAAIAADALGKRDGEHITERLLAAWDGFPGADQAERRQAVVEALIGRPGLAPEAITKFLQDPEPLVRMAAFTALARLGQRAGTGAPPQQRDYPQISDAWFGMSALQVAEVVTERGTIRLALLPRTAPAAVANFVRLAEQGFYSQLLFHRVVPDFVVQTGDPTATGWGGPGYTIRDEFGAQGFGRGTLGMARAGKDTAGSQWFISHSPQPHLDGHYTAFGQVLSGWDVLDAIEQGDRILSVTIVREESRL